MCSNTSNNDLNREYIYVRRLISVLTNDDSDKLIVEKLKGKNLSSLLYNAKIIDNSKNMTANKKILACVIRAIEREKHLCRKRELEQSWGRKFLNSFNCLYPGIKENEDHTEQSVFSRGCLRERKSAHKTHTLSRRTKTSSIRTPKTACRNGLKSRRSNISVTCVKTASEMGKHQFKNKPDSYVESFRNKTFSCVDSIMTGKLEENELMSWTRQQVAVSCVKSPTMAYETIRPPLLRQRKLECVMIYPGKPLPAIKKVEKAEKKSSSTQTSESSSQADPLLAKLPNNIKLQDLLEAASSLINTEAQREYVRSFLKNYEPPFDLSAGFPPYLKLPMEESYMTGQESVYGTNSEMSLRSYLSPTQQPLTADDILWQKEEHVKKYVRDIVLNDPWQDTAESVISGVINESLPHNKANYSQLGACILKHLGAYPESNSVKENRNLKQNPNIPEIILQCTEFFESGGSQSDKKPEGSNQNSEPEQVKDSKTDRAPSIVEINLTEGDGASPKDGQKIQNYCFLDGDNEKVGLLNLSERSLVEMGGCHENSKDLRQNEHGAQGDGSQDRKNLQLREPLKITPSGLEQGGKKGNKAGIFGRRGDGKGKAKMPEPKRVPEVSNITPGVKTKNNEVVNVGKTTRQKVSIYTVTSDKNQGPLVKINDSDESEAIEIIPTMKPLMAQPTTDPNVDTVDNSHSDHFDTQISQREMHPEIIETETPPPEPAQPRWEPTAAEVETFEGVGENQGKPTEKPMSASAKKVLPSKTHSHEKIRGKKKCKVVQKKKARSGQNGVDPSRSCRVM